MTYNQRIKLSKYNTETLQFLLERFVGDDPVGSFELTRSLRDELANRDRGFASSGSYAVPQFSDERDLHGLCHKALLLATDAEGQGLSGARDFFIELYQNFLAQLGVDAVDVADQAEPGDRVVH